MYSKGIIKHIIEENKLKTKVIKTFNDACVISVPDFKEYNLLFGHGMTHTCYAHEEFYWDAYHKNIFREIDFITTAENVSKQFQYITFCMQIDRIDWKDGHKTGIISGQIEIHDFEHMRYNVSFNACFYPNDDNKTYIDAIQLFADISNKSYIDTTTDFLKFCNNYGERGLIKEIIKTACEDILKQKINNK